MRNKEIREEILRQLKELDEQTTDLLHDLKHYTDDQLNTAPSPDVWSPMQVLNHLLKSEMGSLAYVRKKLSYDPVLRQAGLITSLRSWFLWAFLNSPLKFNAPKGVSTQYLPEYSGLEEVTENWKAHRAELRSYLQSLDAGRLTEEVYKHPIAGRLSLRQMIRFFKQHLHRHTQQIQQRLPVI